MFLALIFRCLYSPIQEHGNKLYNLSLTRIFLWMLGYSCVIEKKFYLKSEHIISPFHAISLEGIDTVLHASNIKNS